MREEEIQPGKQADVKAEIMALVNTAQVWTDQKAGH